MKPLFIRNGKWVLIMLLALTIGKQSYASESDSHQLFVPRNLIGPWYSKLQKDSECADRLIKRRGIEITKEGLINSLNGHYQCQMTELQSFDPSSLGTSALGVWSYKADCHLNYPPSSILGSPAKWSEHGEMRMTEGKDAVNFEVMSRTRDDGKESIASAQYFQCY